MSLLFIFVIDTLWITWGGGHFYAQQLQEIGRFAPDGGFDVRLAPGIFVYFLMALGIEVFVFQNKAFTTLREHMFYGGLLGFIVYGVYDCTNRAILAAYPLEMVLVDMTWGTFLFATISALNYQLRHRINFL